jgi:hypothetical protein
MNITYQLPSKELLFESNEPVLILTHNRNGIKYNAYASIIGEDYVEINTFVGDNNEVQLPSLQASLRLFDIDTIILLINKLDISHFVSRAVFAMTSSNN